MRIIPRTIKAGLLALLYVAMVFSPMLHLALGSVTALHERIGHCTGDCKTCGCAAEKRITLTCCCMKQYQQCAKSMDDKQHKADSFCKPPIGGTVFICTAPCGNGDDLSLTDVGSFEVLPVHTVEWSADVHLDDAYTHISSSLVSRRSEPPDPPPRLITVS